MKRWNITTRRWLSLMISSAQFPNCDLGFIEGLWRMQVD
jgi:hypothetical protein